MTTPSFNSDDLDLPAAINDVALSPTVMRVGVVTALTESDNITVKISGSNVLVRASYAFPQYKPLLGDRVVVLKQDAQWFVLSTMSGPIDSVVLNPSFEDGTVGSTPDNWLINVISSAGGTPTFTQVGAAGTSLSGLFDADFGVDSTVAGTSSADVFSTSATTTEGERWTAAYYITDTFIDKSAVTFGSGGLLSELEMFIQFRDASGATIVETSMNYLGLNVDFPSQMYRRPVIANTSVVAPSGTASVRLRFRGTFNMSANSFTSFFMDYVILRRVP